ncbi:MAG: RNA-directed DNA polymerase [Sulfurovum sp.]|nr:MAG: RNA-directed DNA polymerase [Sulfurovum sp.]
MNELEDFYTHNKKVIEYALLIIRKENYTKKYISKKNGSLRELNIPPPFVMQIQKKFNSLLQKLYSPPAPIHGFIEKKDDIVKSIVTNANQHIQKHIVINVDIKNFFATINFGRVRGLFLAEPFKTTEQIATRLTQLVITENQLPQGSPTSPTISNLISLKMDNQLTRLAKRHKMVFTRYADDITFSSYRKNINVQEVIEEIEKIVKINGFSLNPQKTRVQYPHQSQTVTGLKVNQKINLDRKYVRQIRSKLFSWYSAGLDKATELHFEKFNKQSVKYASADKTSSYKKIVLGKIHFLGQVLGQDNSHFIRFLHTYYLLESNFVLDREKVEEIYEKFDLNNPNPNDVIKTFSQIYDSMLIITEGITDVIYIKQALKYFQSKGKFIDLKLRYCTMGGYVDVIKLHKILHDKDLCKSFCDVEKRNFILPLINKNLKTYFVLDADEKQILDYFNNKNQLMKNYFLLDEVNRGYIEKMIDKEIIIDFIMSKGYDIDPTREELGDKSKNGLKEYLKSSKFTDEEIHAPKNTSYIAHKKKIIEKTRLAKHIKNKEDVDYGNFESLFLKLDEIKNH